MNDDIDYVVRQSFIGLFVRLHGGGGEKIQLKLYSKYFLKNMLILNSYLKIVLYLRF